MNTEMMGRLVETEQAKEHAVDELRDALARLERALTSLARERDAHAATAEQARDLYEVCEARKSLAFLHGVLGALATELGLAWEDTAGIVRATKARDGAGRRVEELEAEVARLRKEKESP